MLKRTLLQLTICFAIPVVLAVLLASLYFKAFGIDLDDTVYIWVDFPVIMMMLLILNLYYFTHYLYLHAKAPLPFIEETATTIISRQNAESGTDINSAVNSEDESRDEFTEAETDVYEPPTTGLHDSLYPESNLLLIVLIRGKRLYIDVTNDIGYFYRSGGYYWVRTFAGKTYPTKLSLKEIEDRYAGVHFFRINRQVVVNRMAIASYQEIERRLKVILKDALLTQEHKPEDEMFAVSKYRIKDFLDWFKLKS